MKNIKKKINNSLCWESNSIFLYYIRNEINKIDKKIDEKLNKSPLVYYSENIYNLPVSKFIGMISNIDIPSLSETESEFNEVTTLICYAILIDTWLEPIFNHNMDTNHVQKEFKATFRLKGHLLLDDNAILLPRRRVSWQRDQDDSNESLGLFARHLLNFAYLPAHLNCNSPDDTTDWREPISAKYELWESTPLRINPIPSDPVIAVAPLAEQSQDVTFVPNSSGTKYSFHLNYDETRFADALSSALEQNVHILLIPEMALPEGKQADFNARMQKIIQTTQEEYYARTQKSGVLCLIIAGVVGSEHSDGYHRNYAVVFDANGDQPKQFRQLKLSHWNLTRFEQNLFGITHQQHEHGALSDPIFENSLPGDHLFVLEIPGVGRTATFICADMSQDNPSDWLSLNAALDWLYAPIMDKSMNWDISDRTNTPRPWIVRRSYRTAILSNTIVIATNSVTLSHWVNSENKRLKNTWPPFVKVGIGLAINGHYSPPSYNLITADINEQNIVKIFCSPITHWKSFPLSSS